MSFVFSADEILAMAEQLERSGAAFYRKTAEDAEDPTVKDLLIELASMEDGHIKTFSCMRAELSEKEKDRPTFDPGHEANLYLRSLADTRVFFEKEIDTSSLEGILKAAVKAEKDSILFYLGMKDLVPDYLGKDRLEEIIREEMSHITLLNKSLVNLKKA